MKTRLFIITTLITGLLAGCATPPNINIPKTPPTPVKLKHPPRVALVLGGGGARGFAHVGVLSVLQKSGVPIDLVVGTSAGSVMGSIYADSGNVNHLKSMMKTAQLSDFIDMQNLFGRGGYMKGYGFQKYLMRNMRAKTFRQMKIKFIAMTTNLRNGHAYAIESGPIAPAVLASAAIPGLVVPVKLYGHTLIDGGIANPVAVNIAKRFHPKMIIAVNLVSKAGANIPTSAKAITMKAFAISQMHLATLRSRGASIVLTPAVENYGILDVKHKYQIYHAGQIAAQKALPKILALLKQNNIKRTH
ncbi:MAG: patatin-like phospholipase family protein [Gammaproteobacteria bacterium]|nr:patatin-like phospholipase family protein [Gammaproteobacteria bacterium]